MSKTNDQGLNTSFLKNLSLGLLLAFGSRPLPIAYNRHLTIKTGQTSINIVMKIDQQLISRLEQLTRLELTEAEKQRLEGDLNNILAMVERLQSLDTAGVEPLAYINDEEENRWREDEVANQASREEALKNAPDSDDTYFRTPKVIDL